MEGYEGHSKDKDDGTAYSGMSPSRRDIIIIIIICGTSSFPSYTFPMVSGWWYAALLETDGDHAKNAGWKKKKMEGATKNARPPIGKRHNRHTKRLRGFVCRLSRGRQRERTVGNGRRWSVSLWSLCDIPFSFLYFLLYQMMTISLSLHCAGANSSLPGHIRHKLFPTGGGRKPPAATTGQKPTPSPHHQDYSHQI